MSNEVERTRTRECHSSARVLAMKGHFGRGHLSSNSFAGAMIAGNLDDLALDLAGWPVETTQYAMGPEVAGHGALKVEAVLLWFVQEWEEVE